jgi:hypothetical protein
MRTDDFDPDTDGYRAAHEFTYQPARLADCLADIYINAGAISHDAADCIACAHVRAAHAPLSHCRAHAPADHGDAAQRRPATRRRRRLNR